MANISGYKWGAATPGTAAGVVTWSIAGGGLDITKFRDSGFTVAGVQSQNPSQSLTFDYTAALRQAFTAWSAAANIDFIQVADSNVAAGANSYPNIRIFFGQGDGAGGNYDGIAFYPGADLGGDIFFDLTANYNSDNDYFKSLAIHEIGHAIGLGHESSAPSIMAPWIAVSSLQADDVSGLRTIYGLQNNAPEVYTMSADMLNITVLQGLQNLTINGNANPNTISGSDVAEILFGLAGNDILHDGAGNDQVNGGVGDDRFIVGPGSDTVNGGEGLDTAVMSISRASATVDLRPDKTVLVTQGADADVFSNVERIEFNGGALIYDVPFDADAALVYRIYQASFARVPDEAGFRFWQNVSDQQNLSGYTLADYFRVSPEFAQRYGTNINSDTYVYTLYRNVLQREPDKPGLDFWQGIAAQNVLDRNELMLAFATSPENVTLTAPNITDGYWLT